MGNHHDDIDILIEDHKKKHKKDEGGIKTDSLLRETSSHYIRLIGDADRKARIMLIVTSILLTVGITVLSEGINRVPLVWISATILIITNALTLFFAILSVKPELKSNHFAKETENNMLHYKKTSEYSLADYTRLMNETLEDDDKKREAIIKELYYYGNLLNSKYAYIQGAYRIFLWGSVSTIISYLFIVFVKNA
jgi:hypothetical protein